MLTINVTNIRSQIVGFLDKSVLTALLETLSYEDPNAFFMQRFNPFAGVHYLFIRGSQTFPTGLIRYVENILHTKNVEYQVIDMRTAPILGPELKTHGPPLRDYQQLAVDTATQRQRGVIKAATGSGKSLILSRIAAKLNIPTLILTHKTDLLYQLQRELANDLKVPIGLVGDGRCEIEKITIGTIQTIARVFEKGKKKKRKDKNVDKDETVVLTKAEQITALIKNVQCLITDECFPAQTRIRVSETEEVSIKEIFDNPQITSILSYNEEKRIFEKKSILRKLQLPLNKDLISLQIDTGEGIYKVTCTEDHKFWTPKGYIKAQELSLGDNLKCLTNKTQKIFCCKYCPERFVEPFIYQSHVMKHRRNDESFKDSREVWLKKCAVAGKRHLGKNNPVFRHKETVQKIAASRKAAFYRQSLEEQEKQIRRFKNAPKYKNIPNKPEQAVISFNFPELEYTGDGKFILQFKKPYRRYVSGKFGKNKIPDFKVLNQNKVIEICDREHWHSKQEMNTVTRRYKEIGYKCLVIWADEFKKPQGVRNKIFKFIHNHDGVLIKKKKVNHHSLFNTKFVYDLEVESNHNYIANGILVSNCHHCPSDSFSIVQKQAENAYYRYGASASPWREDNADLLIEAMNAGKLVDIPASLLIERGYLTQPITYLLNYKHERKNRTETYPEIYDLEVVNNVERNKFVVSSALKASAQNKTVLIAVTKVEHGKLLEQMLQVVDPTALFVYGESDSELRQQILQELDQRKRKIVVCTTIFGEGVNVPNLDVLINAKAAASSVDAFQLIGRVLRKTPQKKVAYVVDIFDQQCKYLGQHSKERLRIYQTEPMYILQEISSPNELDFTRGPQ